ncbi:acyltransferase [Priestia megaterium]|uniref:acyltransferase n=1 Tax=Priestia megaterium TaxID=1404 RepID=UPI003C2EC509
MDKLKNFIRKFLGLPNLVYNFVLLKYRHVVYGSNLNVVGRLFCVSNSKDGIKIGNNVSINSSRNANPIGGDTKTNLFAKGNAKIRIGNNVGMSNTTIFACESITVGNNVFIGGSVKIYDTDFHWLDYDKRVSEPDGLTKPVVINDGVFIGAHTIILKGVTIGEKSVVGAGSVVTKNIPKGEIWAGNPARFIRKI